MLNEKTQAPVTAAPRETTVPATAQAPRPEAPGIPKGEARLIARVFKRCHGFLQAAGASSSVPIEFLGALVANESAGNRLAKRFEPLVYRHLRRVARGDEPVYGMLHPGEIVAEVETMLRPKAHLYHSHFLKQTFADRAYDELEVLRDGAIRDLATSWGYTQIMGYHMVGRRGTARDLLDPAIHFHVALELLAEFADEYQLDVRCEFEELFRCWNTGRPYGATTDPDYVERGKMRMGLYRNYAASRSACASAASEAAADTSTEAA